MEDDKNDKQYVYRRISSEKKAVRSLGIYEKLYVFGEKNDWEGKPMIRVFVRKEFGNAVKSLLTWIPKTPEAAAAVFYENGAIDASFKAERRYWHRTISIDGFDNGNAGRPNDNVANKLAKPNRTESESEEEPQSIAHKAFDNVRYQQMIAEAVKCMPPTERTIAEKTLLSHSFSQCQLAREFHRAPSFVTRLKRKAQRDIQAYVLAQELGLAASRLPPIADIRFKNPARKKDKDDPKEKGNGGKK